MDRIGCFVTTGFWPERCVAGTARLDFAGSEPAGGVGGLLPHCRRRAAWPWRAGEPCGRPVVAAFGQARPRGRRGIGLGPVGVALAGGSLRVARCADVAAPEATVAPDTLRVTVTCRVFTRRSRVRVPRFWRRCAVPLVKLGPCGPTLPLRSELAGSGWNYGRRRVMRANVCVNAWRARGPAMAGQAKRPAIAGRARCSLFVASLCEWRLSTHQRGRGTRRVVLSHVELSAHGRRVRCGEAERAKVRRRGGGVGQSTRDIHNRRYCSLNRNRQCLKVVDRFRSSLLASRRNGRHTGGNIKTLREALAYLQRYLTDFGSVLRGPKRFIAKRNTQAEKAFGESLMFLFFSVVVVFVLTSPPLPPGIQIALLLAGQAMRVLLGVVLFAVALRVAWAVVGGKSTLRSFFVTYAYFTGTISVVLLLFLLVAEGVVRVLEPEMYAAARDLADLGFSERVRGLNELGYWDRPAVIAASLIQLVGIVTVGTWSLIGWGAYRELNSLGKWRSFGAFMIFGLLSWVVLAILYFIDRAL